MIKPRGRSRIHAAAGLRCSIFFATIGDKGEQRDRDDRKEQVFAVECAGVEDCNNADSDQVINTARVRRKIRIAEGRNVPTPANTATAKAMRLPWEWPSHV